MDYSDLEEEVVARLSSLDTADCKVLAQPENQDDFKRTVQKARITVAYIGSKGGEIKATDLVRQPEDIVVEVVVQARKLRGVGYSVLKLCAAIKALLIGWKASNAERMYFHDNGITDYSEGVFTYSMKFKCESEIWQLEEEQVDPLIKSITVDDTVTEIPLATNLTVQAIDGIAIVNWDVIPNVDQYMVYVNDNPLTVIDITQVSYGSIVSGNSYTFEVACIRNGIEGEKTSVVLDYVAGTIPDKVTGLSTITLLSNLHQFEWDTVSGSGISYKIYRDGDLIDITNNNSYTDYPLVSSSDYSYTVSAVLDEIEGPQSDPLEITTGFVYFQSLFPSNLIYAFSLRKINNFYTGPCVRLYRSSDGAEMDFGFNVDETYLDINAVNTWLAGATGYVTKWYNQSNSDGDGASPFASDMEQTNLLYMPVLVATTEKNSYIDFSSSKSNYLISQLAAYNQPNTLLSVAKLFPSAITETEYNVIWASNSLNRRNDLIVDRIPPQQSNGTGEYVISAGKGVFSGVYKDTDEHVIGALFNTTNSKIWIDSDLKATGDADTDQLRNPCIGNGYGGIWGWNGYIKECIYFNTDKEVDIVDMQEQQKEYYGIL